MSFRRQRALAWLLLLAYAWTSAFWAKGVVLCFEADGHVTLESAANCGDCCFGDEDSGPRTRREAPTPSVCDCLDVSLSVGNSTAAKRCPGAELARAPLAIFVPVRWTAHGRDACVPASAWPRSNSSSVLRLLSSVVLRV